LSYKVTTVPGGEPPVPELDDVAVTKLDVELDVELPTVAPLDEADALAVPVPVLAARPLLAVLLPPLDPLDTVAPAVRPPVPPAPPVSVYLPKS